MRIKPIEDGNSRFDLVTVKTNHIHVKPTPHCTIHGAMNKVSKFKDSNAGFWRCNTAEGIICRAGCVEITPEETIEMFTTLLEKCMPIIVTGSLGSGKVDGVIKILNTAGIKYEYVDTNIFTAELLCAELIADADVVKVMHLDQRAANSNDIINIFKMACEGSIYLWKKNLHFKVKCKLIIITEPGQNEDVHFKALQSRCYAIEW